jgi:Transaldolase/Fructose-6-phosphate aldolase
VTLIFALARYRAVMDAYLSGLEQAAVAGRDLAPIRSVASFFISRVDSEVDARLDRMASSQATQLKGKAAIANARLAYQAYEEFITSQRWQKLAGLGAQPQRPLWASTGVKEPRLSRHHVRDRTRRRRHRQHHAGNGVPPRYGQYPSPRRWLVSAAATARRSASSVIGQATTVHRPG